MGGVDGGLRGVSQGKYHRVRAPSFRIPVNRGEQVEDSTEKADKHGAARRGRPGPARMGIPLQTVPLRRHGHLRAQRLLHHGGPEDPTAHHDLQQPGRLQDAGDAGDV